MASVSTGLGVGPRESTLWHAYVRASAYMRMHTTQMPLLTLPLRWRQVEPRGHSGPAGQASGFTGFPIKAGNLSQGRRVPLVHLQTTHLQIAHLQTWRGSRGLQLTTVPHWRTLFQRLRCFRYMEFLEPRRNHAATPARERPSLSSSLSLRARARTAWQISAACPGGP